jgi:hypothetical protein
MTTWKLCHSSHSLEHGFIEEKVDGNEEEIWFMYFDGAQS